MTPAALYERAASLFLEVRSLSPDARALRLAEAAADPLLHQEVLSLLAHDLEPLAPHDPARAHDDPDARNLPAAIGPYRILRRLGRGGSGYVLLGEQTSPVHRRVAIKLVPRAMIDPAMAARFDFERRALERTEHPCIARILDAGLTSDGLPYLVMDFVDGPPITTFCQNHRLRLADRLALILDVADAVQHAHQRGVIHRDLKPANILVSDDHGRRAPHVLDFGIAKPADDSFGAAPLITGGLPVGTPAYMAPEQTGSGPVDTRADVYALGALTYQLVCGRTPLASDGDSVELLRRIRSEIPALPSRLRSLDPQFSHDRVARPVLSDLDRVISRALEKDPARRYPTVAALADDLRRTLRREPVEARPQTRTYRAARFAERNKLLIAGAAATVLALLIGIAGLTAGLVAAHRQHREAVIQSNAQAEINRFLIDDLLAAAAPEESNSGVTVIQLLDRASLRVDARFPDQPLVAAAVHHTLGTAYAQLGALDQADHHLQRAIDIRRRWAGADAPDTLRSELAAASLIGQRQRNEEAEAALTPLISRARRILGPDDPALYTALNDLGTVFDTMGRGQDAVEALTEALDGRRRIFDRHSPKVLVTISNLAQAYDGLGLTRRALDLTIEALHVADASPEESRMLQMGLCNNIGATLQDLGRNAEAAPYLRRAADLASREFGETNPMTLTIQANLAGLEARLGDPVCAIDLYDAVVRASAEVLGPDAHDTLAARHGLYNSILLSGRPAQAAAGFATLLPDVARSLGPDHWLNAQVHVSLAQALSDCGRTSEAASHAAAADAHFELLFGPDHPRSKASRRLLEKLTRKLESANPPAPPTSTPPTPASDHADDTLP